MCEQTAGCSEKMAICLSQDEVKTGQLLLKYNILLERTKVRVEIQ